MAAELRDGLYIDMIVDRRPEWWAEGIVLKKDAEGWYVVHPMHSVFTKPPAEPVAEAPEELDPDPHRRRQQLSRKRPQGEMLSRSRLPEQADADDNYESMEKDRWTVRVSEANLQDAIKNGRWRVRTSQAPEADDELRVRLHAIYGHLGLPVPPEWPARVDAARGKQLDALGKDLCVVRVCVPDNYPPWGRPGWNHN